MDLTQVILGEVVTEKAMRLKGRNTYVLRVHPHATKIDIKNALRRHFGVEPADVRVFRLVAKTRLVGRGKSSVKRDACKRAFITLAPKSKPLDLAVLPS